MQMVEVHLDLLLSEQLIILLMTQAYNSHPAIIIEELAVGWWITAISMGVAEEVTLKAMWFQISTTVSMVEFK